MILRYLGFVAVVGGMLLTGAAAADQPARGTATLTLTGKSVKLDRVLIVQYGDEEGMGHGPQLRIFFSDRDLPLAVTGAITQFIAKSYALQAKVNLVEVAGDPAGRDHGAQISVLNAPGLQSGDFATSTSTNAFTQLQVAGGRASGTVSLLDQRLGLSATFDAPITANPVTANLTGKAAVGSAPAKAVIAYYDAVKVGDLTALARYTTAERMQTLIQYRQQAGEKAFREAMQDQPTGAAVAASITRVVVRGAQASVVQGPKQFDELVLEGGAWKVD